MTTSTPFPYSKLEETDSIRLLTIEDDDERFGVRSGHIQCHIQSFSLASVPPYRALSYAWGDMTTRDISLNGHLMQVRSNLWATLAHLRITGYGCKSKKLEGNDIDDGIRWLWVDALCINQNSTEERNHQVQLMGQIYQMAEEVVVWLGCEDLNGSSEIPRFMQDLSKFRSAKDREIGTSILERFTVGLTPFLMLPYWSRMWIVQEVCLNAKVTLLYDRFAANWTNFHAVHAFVAALPIIHKDYLKYNGIAETRSQLLLCQAFALVQHKSKAEKNNLEDLITTCQNSICSDPRDKVYALLGLSQDCTSIGFPIDYAKSLLEVYRDTIRFCTMSRGVESLSPRRVVAFSQTLQRSFNCYDEMQQDALRISSENVDDFPLFDLQGWYTGAVYETGDCCDRDDMKAFQRGKYFEFPHDSQTVKLLLRDYSKLETIITTSYSIEMLHYGNSSLDTHYVFRNRPLESTEVIHTPVNLKLCTPFTTLRGQHGYASGGAKYGDFLCQFQDSDSAILLRRTRPRSEGGLVIVGRAFVVPSEAEISSVASNTAACEYAMGPLLEATEKPDYIKFKLGAVTLQQLTS